MLSTSSDHTTIGTAAAVVAGPVLAVAGPIFGAIAVTDPLIGQLLGAATALLVALTTLVWSEVPRRRAATAQAQAATALLEAQTLALKAPPSLPPSNVVDIRQNGMGSP
jgi:hypothetical protein